MFIAGIDRKMSQPPAQFCPFARQLAGSDPFAASLELTGSSTMRFVAARWISFSQVFFKSFLYRFIIFASYLFKP